MRFGQGFLPFTKLYKQIRLGTYDRGVLLLFWCDYFPNNHSQADFTAFPIALNGAAMTFPIASSPF